MGVIFIQEYINKSKLMKEKEEGKRFFKVGCIFPMVISSDSRMGQHRDDDHQEDAPHFMNRDF